MSSERWISFVVVIATTLIYLQEVTAQLNSSVNNSTTNQMLKPTAIESNLIQRNYLLAQSAEQGTKNDQNRSLKRVSLSNRTITCNDGSHAGFYLRKNPKSKKWIVFLEGGWHCYDIRSCRARWLRLRHLMTSAQWPETRDVGGILSAQAKENPYWHNANHVLIPYCSSDSWSGTRDTPETADNWRFMGALIIRQVIADLIPLGLGRRDGSELLLAGSSAGGLGVMLNLDRIKDFLLNERKLNVIVRGVSDSGWFLDREPYTPSAVASSESVRRGWKLWQGLLPHDCVQKHAIEPWRCYFGYRLYPTLTTPLFVFQWLFDEAQMRADNVGNPVTPQQWNYIHEMGGALRSSLDNVTAVFAPSCIGHAVLSKRDWVNIKIDDISLPAALRCWEHSTRHKRYDRLKLNAGPNQSSPRRHGNKNHKNTQHKKNNSNTEVSSTQLSNHESVAKVARQPKPHRQVQNKRHNRNKQKQNRKKNNLAIGENVKGNSNETNNAERHKESNRRRNQNNTANSRQQRLREEKRRRRRKKQQQQRQGIPLTAQSNNQQLSQEHTQPSRKDYPENKIPNNSAQRKHKSRMPERCASRLLERCSWPQCNHSCPTLTNPLTGEEMRFLELLTSFGLDIEAVAAALGVDMHTLNNMDRTELVNLLTQQSS